MLQKFFELNSPTEELTSGEEFRQRLRAAEIRNLVLKFDPLTLPRPENRIQGKCFTNVSFSKKIISRLEFLNCKFVDCLFIEAEFENCRFVNCVFEGCNTHLIRFDRTFIDPQTFVGMLDPTQYSNIGVNLFSTLLSNSRTIESPEFIAVADFNFRKWKRYRLQYDPKLRGKNGIGRWARIGLDYFYEITAGYGWKLWNFALTSVGFLLFVLCFNYVFWDKFEFRLEAYVAANGLLSVAYYTLMILSTLGISSANPQSFGGMLAVCGEALAGPIWLSVLAALIIKKIVR